MSPTSKSQVATTMRERWYLPVSEHDLSSDFVRRADQLYVETRTCTRINACAPRGTEPDLGPASGRGVFQAVLRAGDELGPYRLLKWLGRGGEGDVWKAVRLERAHDLVALKILKPSHANSPARKAQFRREAERGTGLVGPSLLTVYELNEVNGYHYMTFPYVESTPLREIIRQRGDYLARGDMEDVHPFATMKENNYLSGMTRALAKVVHALASVHDQQIVHRDVKPANILIDNRRHGRAYLCDFGLGRDIDVATSEQMRDGAGTPLYMAPERLLRLIADEVRCDIYSMGVTLCEALTLKRPFHIPDDLPAPALAPYLARTAPLHPRALDPDFPDKLAAIITRAMARNPHQRYSSARELAADLDQFAFDWSSHLPALALPDLIPAPTRLTRADAGYKRISVVGHAEMREPRSPKSNPDFMRAREQAMVGRK